MDNMREIMRLLKKAAKRLHSIKPVSMDLVWTNPDPEATFATQVKELDLSQYKFVLVLYRYSTSGGLYKSEIVPVGGMGQLVLFTHVNSVSAQTESPYIFNRDVSVTKTGIQFYGCVLRLTNNSTYATLQNNNVIPIEVYGIKLGGY